MTPEIERELREIASRFGLSYEQGLAMARQQGWDAPTTLTWARQEAERRAAAASSERGHVH